MINYVEYLRATRALKIVAIILGVVLVIVAVTRIYTLRYESSWTDFSRYTNSSTAHVTKVKLPDGSTKTVIDDPVKKVHAEITDRGYAGKQIVITEPSRGNKKGDNVTIGSINVDETSTKGVRRTVVSTNADVNVKYLFVAALPLMLLFATLVAGPLAKENEGHAELAMTKPVSRTQYAFGAFAMDIAGIVVTSLLCVVIYIVACAMFQLPHFVTSDNTASIIALCYLSTIGFYSLVTAVSASMKRGVGAAIGISWAAALILPGLSHINGEPGTLPAVLGTIFRTINRINPISYLPGSFHVSTGEPILDTTRQLAVLISSLLIIAYLAAALLQWRRVEA